MARTNKLAIVGAQIEEGYLNGASFKELGTIHGASTGTVRNVLLARGVTPRPRGRRKKENDNVLQRETLQPDTV